jgi:DNA-binding HxlR family transcriptional regulator
LIEAGNLYTTSGVVTARHLCPAFGVYEKKMKKKHLKFPNRKISETFLEFSSPLLDAIGQSATKDQVEKVLQITYSVWNSIVLDAARGGEKNISMLRETIKDDQIGSTMIEQLISRKMELYADDLRLIGEFSISQKRGKWRLRADARDPSTIR